MKAAIDAGYGVAVLNSALISDQQKSQLILFYHVILLMEEMRHHSGCIKPGKKMGYTT